MIDKIIRNEKKKKKFNLGIQILRMLLSFWVIIFHCCKIKNKKLKYYIIGLKLHVPTFIIISFYFLYFIFEKRDINKIKERIFRLFIPFFIYPLIIWIYNNLSFIFFKVNRFNRKLLLYELIIQISFGRIFHSSLWFHFALLFLTFLYSIIIYIFKEYYLYIFHILLLLSYILQYSNINYNFFNKFSVHIKFSIGMLIEVIPISLAGIFLNSTHLIKYLKLQKEINLIFCIFWIIFLIKYRIFHNLSGYNFQGLFRNICSVLLFIIFIFLPFEKIQNDLIISLIEIITRYTGGIYYLHNITNYYLKKKLSLIKDGTLYDALIIYIFSYFLSFIGFKILGKTIFKII